MSGEVHGRAVFFNSAGALRAPWRIALFIALSVASTVVVSAIAAPMLEALFVHAGLPRVDTTSWIEVAGLLAATAIALRQIDKRSWSAVWLDRGAARPALLVYGFAIGAFAIGVPVALLIVAHWEVNVTGAPGSWLAAAIRVSLTLLPAALVEELLMRGYILSVLRDAWGWTGAIAFTSIAFGLLHVMNPGATPGSLALVTLAGFFLAAVLYATRSLYAAWMAHFAWNFTMAVLFHTAVSGLPMEAPGYRYVDAGPDWATGGPWGPEGGALAAFGMIAGMAFLFARRRRPTTRTAVTTGKSQES